MARPHLEVADVLAAYGDVFVARHRGHLSRGQRKVISAIRARHTAALGGHVARCEACDHIAIAYNSCRNRHCPKCQGQTARAWLEQRQADLLPVPYYHAPALACPCCGGRLAVIERFRRGESPQVRPTTAVRIDTS